MRAKSEDAVKGDRAARISAASAARRFCRAFLLLWPMRPQVSMRHRQQEFPSFRSLGVQPRAKDSVRAGLSEILLTGYGGRRSFPVIVVAVTATPSCGLEPQRRCALVAPRAARRKPPESSGFGSPWLAWPCLTSVDHMVAWPAGSAEDDVPLAAEAYNARSAGGDLELNAAGTIT